MSATHNITLDITKQRLRLDQSVHVRVGDASSQVVECQLTKAGAAYTPPSGSTAKIEILKADNTWSVSNATISGSNVSATLPTQAISAPGECKRAYFRLISGNAEDTTEDFYLAVYANATDEAIESQSYTDQLDALIAAADEELQDTIEEVRDIRTGFDGEVHATAGDAVREQVDFLIDVAEGLGMAVTNLDFDNPTEDGKKATFAYGTIVDAAGFAYIGPFAVHAGDILIADLGEATNCAVISDKTDATNCVPLLQGKSATKPNDHYHYTFEQDYENIIICYRTEAGYVNENGVLYRFSSEDSSKKDDKQSGFLYSSNASRPTLVFDTVNKTVSFGDSTFCFVGNKRYTLNSSTVLTYGTVGGNSKYLVYRDDVGFLIINYQDFDSMTDTFIEAFSVNVLNAPSTNTIRSYYIADGVGYNIPSAVRPDSIYVNGATGSDTNTGTSASPLATIQAAIDKNPRTIHVAQGTYNESININNKRDMSIVPSNHTSTPEYINVTAVTIRNCSDIRITRVDANANSTDVYAFDIVYSENVEINDCIAQYANQGGFHFVRSSGSCNHCTAHDIGNSDYPVADGFNVHNYGNVNLVGCLAYNCQDDGVSPHDSCSGTYTDCECYNCYNGAGFAIASTGKVTLNGCYVHECDRGLQFASTSENAMAFNSVFKNNTKDVVVSNQKTIAKDITYDTSTIAEGSVFIEY